MKTQEKAIILANLPRSLYRVLPKNAEYFKHPTLLGCIGIRIRHNKLNTITPAGLYSIARLLKERGVECKYFKRSSKTGRAKLVVGEWIIRSSKRNFALNLDIAYIEHVPEYKEPVYVPTDIGY